MSFIDFGTGRVKYNAMHFVNCQKKYQQVDVWAAVIYDRKQLCIFCLYFDFTIEPDMMR